jgi:hypothetical protein
MGRSYVFDVVGESVILANILNFDTLDHKIVMFLLVSIRVLDVTNEFLI